MREIKWTSRMKMSRRMKQRRLRTGDAGDREAVHQSLKTYSNTLQVDNDADSEPAPLPEQAPQTAVDEPTPISQTGVYESGFRRQTPQQKGPLVSNSMRVEILKAGMHPSHCLPMIHS
jgi:hypothetical protein